MKLDKWVVDIETKNIFSDVGGVKNIHLLKISVIGVYSYLKDEYFAYEEKDFPLFEKEVQNVGAFIGFALDRFDIPVLKSQFPEMPEILSYDILEELEKQRGHRIKLDNLAMENLSVGKSGTGLEAVELYKEGKIEELKKYCLNDVKITKELYDLSDKDGYLTIPSSYLEPAKLDLSHWNDIDEKIEAIAQKRAATLMQGGLF